MNPNLCRIALRPRGPFETFDLALRMIMLRLGSLIRCTLLVVLPPWLILTVIAYVTRGHWGILIPTVLLAWPIQTPFTAMFGRFMFADDVALLDVAKDVLYAAPKLIVACVATSTLVGVSSIMCAAPVPLAQMAVLYLPETILLEKVPMMRAFNRAMRLGFGHAALSLGGSLGFWAITLWAGLVGEAVGQMVVDSVLSLGTPVGSVSNGQVTPFFIGGVLLAQPLFAVYRLMLYVDTRTRMEGWDLQVMLRAAGMKK